MRYFVGHTYFQGSLLFIQRLPVATETVEQARIVLAYDVADMNEAMEIAAEYGITTVQRVLPVRRPVGVGWPH
jgi:hypothetical protein